MALTGVVVGLVVVVVVQAFMLRSDGWTVPLGNVAEWLGAIGGIATVGALVVAWLVYRQDVNARREDIIHRQDAERRQQAEMVTAWIVGVGTDTNATIPYVDVALNNDSKGVVYDIRVLVRFHPTQALSHFEVPELGLVPSEGGAYFPELPPGTWVIAVPSPEPPAFPGGVEIYFRDQRTVAWRRGVDGYLVGDATPPFRTQMPEFWDEQSNQYFISLEDITFPRLRPRLRKMPNS